jgi:multiple sugar transport system substrate-binding protein
MKRHLITTLAAATGVLLLASCAGASSTPGGKAGDEKTTIKMTVWNYATTPEFKALVEGFQATHPNITVQPVDILADDYPKKLTTMLAGGDTTDILTMKNVTDYARYANRNQLLPLTDEAKAVNKEAVPSLGTFELDGKYFALPYRQDFWVLFYNKSLLAKAGVAESSLANLTWGEYATLAKKLTSGSGTDKNYGTYLHTWRSVVQAISSAQTGGDQLGGDYSFFKDQYAVALDLQKSGATLPFATAFTQKITYKSVFAAGKTATLPMGTWYASTLLADKAAGKSTPEWGMAPMPQLAKGTKVTTFGSPTAFAVNKKAKNADAAKTFITWATGPEGAKAIAKVGVVPALNDPAVKDIYFSLKGIPGDEVAKKAFSPDEVKLEMPISEKSSDVDQILKEQHELIMSGEKDLDAGLAEMGSRVHSEVD